GQRAIRGNAIPTAILQGAAAHEVVLLAVTAVDQRATTDAAIEVLAGPDGPLLRYVLARVDAVTTLSPVFGVALVQNQDQPVVPGGLDEREMGTMALQLFTGRRGYRLAPAGLVDALAQFAVADAHPFQDGVMDKLGHQAAGPAVRAGVRPRLDPLVVEPV